MAMNEDSQDHGHGKVVAVAGPVVDVAFKPPLPPIRELLRVPAECEVLLEVQAHPEPGVVRTVSLSPTSGLRRGELVERTFGPLTVPVGNETLGRLFNVMGEPIDGGPPVNGHREPIYRPPLPIREQSAQTGVFQTGIKMLS